MVEWSLPIIKRFLDSGGLKIQSGSLKSFSVMMSDIALLMLTLTSSGPEQLHLVSNRQLCSATNLDKKYSNKYTLFGTSK